jgi:hypothetical protein
MYIPNALREPLEPILAFHAPRLMVQVPRLPFEAEGKVYVLQFHIQPDWDCWIGGK